MMNSRTSLRRYNQNSVSEENNDKQTEGKKNKRKGALKSALNDDEWYNVEEFNIALYCGNLVALKKIYKANIPLTRAVQIELKLVNKNFCII